MNSLNLHSQRTKTNIILDSFYVALINTKNRILMLDYDGTVAPFKIQRNQAYPYNGIREILNQIISGEKTRVIIISGRWTKDLIPLLGLKKLPEIWGSHGLERLKSNGEYQIRTLNEKTLAGLAEADSLVEKNKLGHYCEVKPGSVALHWRGLAYSQKMDIKQKVVRIWKSISREKDLELHSFNGGIELRVPGINKGDAVQTILSESNHDNCVAAYLGDDFTDEDAFKAMHNKGLGVLVNKTYRKTFADLWLKPPDQVLQFLINWDEIIESNGKKIYQIKERSK